MDLSNVPEEIKNPEVCKYCGAIKSAALLAASLEILRDNKNYVAIIKVGVPGVGSIFIPMPPNDAVEMGEELMKAGQRMGGQIPNRG
jgi:hypothetical protein